MTDGPWLGDACSLVDALRAGDLSPVEALDASLAAIESSELNAFSFLDAERARAGAAAADVSRPFGGVPIGVKELDHVAGWPSTEASLVFKDRVADYTDTSVQRITADGGAVAIGLTTASEFGGLNVSVTKLNGVTGNPWDPGRTAGGSSGGSASAVAGGLVPIATGGDGGGSIRIPAGFNGLLGVKGTAGRIPRGPHTEISPLTVVVGCLARSVRDAARWYDVAAGYDTRDPYSLPTIEGWEADLGTHDLAGRTVAISPDLWGLAHLNDGVAERVQQAGEDLAAAVGLELVDAKGSIPPIGVEWALSNLVQLNKILGDRYPECSDQLTQEIAFGMALAKQMFTLDTASSFEANRTAMNEAMAEVFDQADFVICSTNPGPAFGAGETVDTGGSGSVDAATLMNAGALTMPANMYGNPSIQVPIGLLDGLPVGMQVMGPHHSDQALFDLALAAERDHPWPLTAPDAPR